MRATSSLVTIALLSASLVISLPASSTVVTVGCANAGVSCTLDELAGGATIAVSDKVFSQWSVQDFSTLPVSLAHIDVIGIDDGGDAGIRYQTDTALSAQGFDLIDLEVSFLAAAVDPAMRIVGGDVEIEAFEFAPGNVGGFVTLFSDIFDDVSLFLDGSALTADNNPPPLFVLSDSWAFAPQSSVQVENVILVGGDDFTDVSTLSAFSQRFMQVAVPEPSVLSLFVGAFVAAYFGRKPSRRAKAMSRAGPTTLTGPA